MMKVLGTALAIEPAVIAVEFTTIKEPAPKTKLAVPPVLVSLKVI